MNATTVVLDVGVLRRLTEDWRHRATATEVRYGRERWVQSINVITALELCAEDLEALVAKATADQTQPNPS